MQMNPYLLFEGQCEATFKFYAKSLGGKIEMMMPHEGSPAAGQVPAEWLPKILHARMTIGDQVIMASDAPPGRQQKPQGFSLNLAFQDPADAESTFQTLAENGTVVMPIQKTFWAERFGMLVDQFGIPWMVNCEKAVEKAA